MHPCRHKPLDLADGTCQLDFLALFQTRTLDRAAGPHGDVADRIVAVRDRGRQALRRKRHARAVIIGNRDDHIAGCGIQNNINPGILQRIDHTRLFSLGKRCIERCALRLLGYDKEHHADDGNDNGAQCRQHLTNALSARQAVQDGHRSGFRNGRYRGFGFFNLPLGGRIHHCRCFCHWSVSRS